MLECKGRENDGQQTGSCEVPSSLVSPIVKIVEHILTDDSNPKSKFYVNFGGQKFGFQDNPSLLVDPLVEPLISDVPDLLSFSRIRFVFALKSRFFLKKSPPQFENTFLADLSFLSLLITESGLSS